MFLLITIKIKAFYEKFDRHFKPIRYVYAQSSRSDPTTLMTRIANISQENSSTGWKFWVTDYVLVTEIILNIIPTQSVALRSEIQIASGKNIYTLKKKHFCRDFLVQY